MRILVVEDEKDLNFVLSKGLKKNGYAVDQAYDGQEALDLYHSNQYDLIILDLNIPKIDGLEVLRTIRSSDLNTKIMILSAQIAIEQRVKGLDMGANDYVIKPFDFRELDARIRTLLRMDFKMNPNILVVKDLTLNTNSAEVHIKDKKIELTRKEYAILHYLLVNKGNIVSNEEIFEHVWNNEADEFSKALKFHVHSLKKKLAKHSNIEYIENRRGLGYRVIVDEKD